MDFQSHTIENGVKLEPLLSFALRKLKMANELIMKSRDL